jgi:predicted dehydrogenase
MNERISSELTRRRFLVGSIGIGLAASLPGVIANPVAAPEQKLRAAVIGSTGRGDYGHNLDRIFNDLPNVSVVGLADPNEAGRARAVARSGALRHYEDYREMLAFEKPQLVSVALRWSDQHHAIALAALQAGAHLFVEKPFMQTLAEADEVLALAAKMKLKIVVAHQMRLGPNIQLVKKMLEAGELGELREIRAHGKQDRRVGGEDLIVLGVHLFDLMRFFGGDPIWCEARVQQAGRDITRADARAASEKIGPVAGDEINAQFGFPKDVKGTFTSSAKNREAGPWGIELVGTKSSVRILADILPTVQERKVSATATAQAGEWRPLANDPVGKWTAAQKSVFNSNRRLVNDWLAAIKEDREPVCSGHNGMKSLEMAHAVFAAGLSRERVSFPLKERKHPLK